MTTETINTATARQGRERSCTQCGSVFRSLRPSRFCSNACRCRAKRGYSPKVSAPSGTSGLSMIGKALLKLDMAGPIGPVTTLGLTVPRDHALAELQYIFNRKGWGHLSADEFDAALSTDGIRSYNTSSPEALQRQRLQGRQRVATARL